MKNSTSRTGILVTAWAVIALLTLPRIISQEIFNYPFSESLHFRLTALILIAGYALTFPWKDIRALRPFFGLFMVLIGAQWLVHTRVDQLPIYQSWLKNPSFSVYMLAEQSLNLMVTLAIMAFLWMLTKRRTAFFWAAGELDAPVEPIKWLGVKSGEKWNKFGPILAVCISLGTLTFLVMAGRPQLSTVVKVLPFLPAVLLAAMLNAFNEEMTYKASFLSVLEGAAGRNNALYLMAAFFGILHFYGVPYGIVGVLMATFLGWLLGKSMLETRGFFWAWFIHFLQDVLIFTFMAIGSITPGG